MGGYGSGRRCTWGMKTTTESQRRIDIRWLKKQGYLQPGTSGLISWSRGDEKTGSVRYRIKTDRMMLIYRYREGGGDWKSVEQIVSFDLTPCNFGGCRTWFLCTHCGNRVAVLYGAGKYFFCRHCYDLAYSSQQEEEVDRLMRKAWKLRRRIGANEDLTESIWLKPKNMHWKTFERLRREADHASKLSWQIMGQRLGIHF